MTPVDSGASSLTRRIRGFNSENRRTRRRTSVASLLCLPLLSQRSLIDLMFVCGYSIDVPSAGGGNLVPASR
jgi:hypothetical protein